MSEPVQTVATFPQTIYAVSAVYFHKINAILWASHSTMFAVSGVNPLTEDEACERGRKVFEKSWDLAEPLANFELGKVWCISMYMTRG